jgi:hypothetical protein
MPAIPVPITMQRTSMAQLLVTVPVMMRKYGNEYKANMKTVFTFICVLAYLEMLFFLKCSLTRWLSVEKKSARLEENLMTLVCFIIYGSGKETAMLEGNGQGNY